MNQAHYQGEIVGNCKHCGGKAGFLSRKHQECEATFSDGCDRMVALATEAVGREDFSESALVSQLSAIAADSYISEESIPNFVGHGWHNAVMAALADGVLTLDEEVKLKAARQRLGIDEQAEARNEPATKRDIQTVTRLEQAVEERRFRELCLMAQEAALATDHAGAHFSSLATAFKEYGRTEEDGKAILVAGWQNAVRDSLKDSILPRDKENALGRYRRHFSLTREELNADGDFAELEEAIEERPAREARALHDRLCARAKEAALATTNGNAHFSSLVTAFEESGLSDEERKVILVTGWKNAVWYSLQDGLLSQDEENALSRYMRTFKLTAQELNTMGHYNNVVKARAIRQAAQGLIPERKDGGGPVPFNLQKSEQLVWVFEGVDYYEVKTRRERRGSSHGASIRVAKGVYYRPSTFSSRIVETEETVHEGTGTLGITSKSIYFHSSRKKFRIPYNKIVSFDAHSNGIEVMRDAQTAKPQIFRAGRRDGWFLYNLATNLAQNQ